MSQNIIAKLYEDHKKTPDRFLKMTEGALDRIEKTFPSYSSFLMEFIQNADDAKSTSLNIELNKGTLLFTNNGKKFSEGDVEALCNIGNSEKNVEEGYIGYLGVGFKSIFLISDFVEVHSGKFHFKFDKNYWAKEVPWQVLPILIDDNADSKKTEFRLKITGKDGSKAIKKDLSSSNLNNRILLFLQNVQKITINDADNKSTRVIEKYLEEKNKHYKKYLIKETVNGKLETETPWLVFSSTCKVPKAVQEDEITKKWERQKVKTREVAIAFLLDENNHISIEKQGTAHIGVFSFMPLKEIPSGLNYLIQGDYITTAGRADLARENKWNEWISIEIFNLIKGQCIPYLLTHDDWKWNITRVLYTNEGGHEVFQKFIKDPLNEYLELNDVLIDINEKTCDVHESKILGSNIMDYFNNKELEILYPEDKILHKKCHVHSKLLREYNPTLAWFISEESFERLAKKYARERNKEWFSNLYCKLAANYPLDYFYKHTRYNVERDRLWRQISNADIMLTNRFSLFSPENSYINPDKIRIPKEITKEIKVVHPNFMNDNNFFNLLTELRTQRHSLKCTNILIQLDQSIISTKLKDHYMETMNPSKWKKLDEDGKLNFTYDLLHNYISDTIDLDAFNYITLKTLNGNWLKPNNILFSKQFHSEHSLHEIYENKLLDGKLEFLSDCYLDNIGDDKYYYQNEISNFFISLGVDSMLEERKKNKIIERIGVLCSLNYEKKKNRAPIEIGQSRNKKGDILSIEKNKSERIIEVKARESQTPAIELSVNQSKAMRENNNHFLYLVNNALSRPELVILSNDKVMELASEKISISHAKWNKPKHFTDKIIYKL